MSELNKIRNFCIIAHIDHGKSTLADRLIEFTGALSKREMKDRVMDTLEIEQERGITIKLQTARLNFRYTGSDERFKNQDFVLNLIDTPGHVDFSYEVSRSVAASEGALLLVDASQGIQAQTLSTIYKAIEYDLKILPVLNKVDLPNAEVDRVKKEVMSTFGFKDEEIILASGKTGIGTEDILNALIDRVSPPDKEDSLVYLETSLHGSENEKSSTKALIFDAFYHEYMGVIALVKVLAGNIKKGDKLYLKGTQEIIDPIEIGYLKPKMESVPEIYEGEVGYIATGLKDIRKVHTGDTVFIHSQFTKSKDMTTLAGYQEPKPMVYASLYPVEADEYPQFAEALERLSLNDAALSYQKEHSQALGTGFVCGFLGLLHLEVTQDRLEREFGINLISTTPTVEFRIKLTTKDYSKVPQINVANIDENTNIAQIRNASEFPEGSLYDYVEEPWVKMEIISPENYIGDIMDLGQRSRGIYRSMDYVNKEMTGTKTAILTYEIPTVEMIVNFFDKLKSISNGYASMDYSFLEYRKSDIVKVAVLVNDDLVEPLSFLTHKDNAERRSRDLVAKLKDIIPRQNFKVPIQAAIGGKVIARETIQAYRKDVTAKLYGGDETRKKKLLEKQKKGKKRMKMFGSVEIPKEAFLAALKN
jgi:GTP-binding protein LepA